MFSKTLFIVLLASIVSQVLAAYQLQQDYSGDAFYQNFDFFSDPDPTDGHVQYQTIEQANSTGLAGFIQTNNATKAIFMGVDSETVAPDGRGSVRVSSKQSFNHALVIADILHMPGGICGVWPAFWMLGPDWPNDGEIDIVEGVNDQTKNLMTLHSSAGPVLNAAADSFKGNVITSNCDVNAPDQFKNAGCSIGDDSDLSFGTGFNGVGGGVFATEWTSDFVKIWFFPRGSIPADVASSNPQPNADWGTPRSVFQGDFNFDSNFRDLSLVFDTTFCGAWAGETWTSSSCASLAPTCNEYVTNNPQAFKDAFWAINTLQVFTDDGQANSNTTQSAPAPAVPAAPDPASTVSALPTPAPAVPAPPAPAAPVYSGPVKRRGGAAIPMNR